MENLKTGTIIIFLLLIFYGEAFSQKKRGRSSNFMTRVTYKNIGYMSVGGSVGIMNYFGDLNPLAQYVSTDLRKTRPTISVNVARKLGPRWSVRLEGRWGRITANDFQAADPDDERHRYRYIRNTHFRNDVFELGIMATYDLRPSRFVYYKRMNYTPYLLIGIAGFYHNPKAKTPVDYEGPEGAGQWVALRPLKTEGQGITRSVSSRGGEAGELYSKPYSLFQPAIPLGAGVRFKLTDRMDLSFEVVYRMLFTDFLDDVSGNYANPADLQREVGELSPLMANRSYEAIEARTGQSREAERNRLIEEVNPTYTDAIGNLSIAGYGADGDKRGEAEQVDIYIVTAFHLNYIINVGLKCPRFK